MGDSDEHEKILSFLMNQYCLGSHLLRHSHIKCIMAEKHQALEAEFANAS